MKKSLVKLDTRVIDKVNDFIDHLKLKSSAFKSFYSQIEKSGDIYIIGGSVRDISMNNIPRDLDIIVDTSNEKLKKIIQQYDHKLNKFGGSKLEIDGIKLDVWTLQAHWAFSNQGSFSTKTVCNISKTAILNLNSAVINLSKHKICSIYFNRGIKKSNKTLYNLDLISSDENLIKRNSFLEGQIRKTLQLKSKYNLNPSDSVKELFSKQDTK